MPETAESHAVALTTNRNCTIEITNMSTSFCLVNPKYIPTIICFIPPSYSYPLNHAQKSSFFISGSAYFI